MKGEEEQELKRLLPERSGSQKKRDAVGAQASREEEEMPIVYTYMRFGVSREVTLDGDLISAAERVVEDQYQEFCGFVSLSEGERLFTEVREVQQFLEEQQALAERRRLQTLIEVALASQSGEEKDQALRQLALYLGMVLGERGEGAGKRARM